MTPLPAPPPQYSISVTEAEADAARRFIADALRPPVREDLKPYEMGAVAVFARLSSVLDAAREGRREKKEGGNVG